MPLTVLPITLGELVVQVFGGGLGGWRRAARASAAQAAMRRRRSGRYGASRFSLVGLDFVPAGSFARRAPARPARPDSLSRP